MLTPPARVPAPLELTHRVRYRLDGEHVELTVEGETAWGEQRVLLEADDDLTAGTTWAPRGFCVTDYAQPSLLHSLRRSITQLVTDQLAALGTDVAGLELEKYHEYVDDELHSRAVRRMQSGFSLGDLGPVGNSISAAVGRACDTEVTAAWRGGEPPAVASDAPWSQPDRFCVRLVRPGRTADHNPIHKDAWLDDLRHSVNVYVPVCGSNARSSLPVVPRSHRWEESCLQRTIAGALVAGRRFTVPALTSAHRTVDAIRPNPAPGQLMVFSPYLLHGGAANDQEDTTRVSMELHFWRVGTPRCEARHSR